MGAVLRGSSKSHSAAVEIVMDALQSVFGQRLFVMKQVSGMFRRVGVEGDGGGHAVRDARFKIGVSGMADIGGWKMFPVNFRLQGRPENPYVPGEPPSERPSFAIPFQIEIKTGGGAQSGKQKAFQLMCERTACPYFLVEFKNVDDLKYTSDVVRKIVRDIGDLR